MTEHGTPEKGSDLGTPRLIRILLSHGRRGIVHLLSLPKHATGWQPQVCTTRYVHGLKASLTATY